MSKVRLQQIHKSFGEVVAVRNLDLEIRQGEFFSLLGPSGCGKTTTLRMIAGFEFPTKGQIFFDERDVTYLKPNRRNTGMVFQNYALFPHMSVFENVAFGLKARKVEKSRAAGRVAEALRLVDLAGFERRRVTELSGGQQQRVALARALVIEPGILLLDEPLSNLDAKLREETRHEIRHLQRRLGITTIYVTHDQEEALGISERIAVMKDGLCEQIGRPEEIYRQPATRFVAQFVGQANIFEGRLALREARNPILHLSDGVRILLPANLNHKLKDGDPVTVCVRPEKLKLLSESNDRENALQARVKKVSYSGAMMEYELEARGQILRVKLLAGETTTLFREDEMLWVHVPRSEIQLLPSSSRG